MSIKAGIQCTADMSTINKMSEQPRRLTAATGFAQIVLTETVLAQLVPDPRPKTTKATNSESLHPDLQKTPSLGADPHLMQAMIALTGVLVLVILHSALKRRRRKHRPGCERRHREVLMR